MQYFSFAALDILLTGCKGFLPVLITVVKLLSMFSEKKCSSERPVIMFFMVIIDLPTAPTTIRTHPLPPQFLPDVYWLPTKKKTPNKLESCWPSIDLAMFQCAL